MLRFELLQYPHDDLLQELVFLTLDFQHPTGKSLNHQVGFELDELVAWKVDGKNHERVHVDRGEIAIRTGNFGIDLSIEEALHEALAEELKILPADLSILCQLLSLVFGGRVSRLLHDFIRLLKNDFDEARKKLMGVLLLAFLEGRDLHRHQVLHHNRVVHLQIFRPDLVTEFSEFGNELTSSLGAHGVDLRRDVVLKHCVHQEISVEKSLNRGRDVTIILAVDHLDEAQIQLFGNLAQGIEIPQRLSLLLDYFLLLFLRVALPLFLRDVLVLLFK